MNKSNDFQRNKKKYDEHRSMHSTQIHSSRILNEIHRPIFQCSPNCLPFHITNMKIIRIDNFETEMEREREREKDGEREREREREMEEGRERERKRTNFR